MDENRTQITQIMLMNTDYKIKIKNIIALQMFNEGNLCNGFELYCSSSV